MSNVLLQVDDLKKYFPVKTGFRNTSFVRAVDGVSFKVYEGETLGLVGESGCGKSTTGRTILRLLEPTEGKISFAGVDVVGLRKQQLRHIRKEMQIVFQDPYASLNPRLTVGESVAEALEIHKLAQGQAKQARIAELLEIVGVNPKYATRYPHEFSGGQRQRIGIARALAVEPRFIVCDEPVSALDVSVQAQVINLMKELQQEFKLSYLFIAHDLGVVRHISDRVAVMYLGKIVELAETDQMFKQPLHPYTQALLSAVPVSDPDIKRERIILEGDIPSPLNPPTGCRFHTRCPYAQEICKSKEPLLQMVGEGHLVACHLVKQNPDFGGESNA